MTIADPDDPNYFRLASIVAIRGELSRLRDWISEPADWPDDELVDITNKLITLAWPAAQPGFDVAFERDRLFLARIEGAEPCPRCAVGGNPDE